ncbi:MAG: S-layer homology domain-containing protein [Leptolyngbya sp.]|nr:S-layer homology domain-containing protein [Leptolyngbya sp.]
MAGLVSYGSVSAALVSAALVSVALATGCAGGSFGDALQQSLEADPQLQAQFPQGEAAAPESAPPAGNPASENADRPGAGSAPPPGDLAFVGPLPPENWGDNTGDNAHANAQPSPSSQTSPNTLLEDVPADLQPYVQDWIALGRTAEDTFADIPFQPSRTITRGEYAQWLFAANNLFYRDQPAQRIRPGAPNDSPAFQDVPPSHPYYSAIQGLAEAGIIPSALAGNATAVTFRPDDPLTREALVLWKVPLDTRTVLPLATVEAVQTAWGFQDAAEVDPFALRAVLADHQAGDFANILRAFGFTTLFQPKRAVSQAEAAAVLWRFGHQTEGVSAQDVLRRGATAPPSQDSPLGPRMERRPSQAAG